MQTIKMYKASRCGTRAMDFLLQLPFILEDNAYLSLPCGRICVFIRHNFQFMQSKATNAMLYPLPLIEKLKTIYTILIDVHTSYVHHQFK